MAARTPGKPPMNGVKLVDTKKSDTGLFAAVCRHDVGLRLINLHKTGEKCGSCQCPLDPLGQHA